MADEILKLEVDYPLLCTRGAVLFPKNDMNIEEYEIEIQSDKDMNEIKEIMNEIEKI